MQEDPCAHTHTHTQAQRTRKPYRRKGEINEGVHLRHNILEPSLSREVVSDICVELWERELVADFKFFKLGRLRLSSLRGPRVRENKLEKMVNAEDCALSAGGRI